MCNELATSIAHAKTHCLLSIHVCKQLLQVLGLWIKSEDKVKVLDYDFELRFW
jgi:hypothetical protein